MPSDQPPKPLRPRVTEGIFDIEDAREHVEDLLSQGFRPLITIPEEFVDDVLAYGVTVVPKQDLLSGKKFSFIAGTIGLDPYLPESEQRRVFEIDPSSVRIEPRMTGADSGFHGVVGFPDGIPAHALLPLGLHTASSWRDPGATNKGPLH